MNSPTVESQLPNIDITVNVPPITVRHESHWRRNIIATGAVLAAGAFALRGCGTTSTPVEHGPAHVHPFAALSYVSMPESINAVQAGHATNKDFTRIYGAICTPAVPHEIPFFGGDQTCTPDVGIFNGDTGAEVDGKLTLVAADKSMFVTVAKDDSEFGWHPLVVVNRDKFDVAMVDPAYTTDPLHKGVGNSMKQVAIHKFNDPNADEGTYMNWLEQRATDAEKTACTSTLIEYVPASVSKIAKDWLLGGAVSALQAKDTASHAWLTKLGEQVPHEEYLSASEYDQLLQKVHTGTFTKSESTVADTTAQAETNRTSPDFTTGISVAVPESVPRIESYTFTIFGGTKKFTEEVHTDSTDCQLSPEDQAKLDELQASVAYVVDTGRQTGGY